MAARIDLNHKVHVLTKKEELDSVRVGGKVVVVLDILFATTTMVTALAHGYADQPHLIRDFKELGGASPQRLMSSLGELTTFFTEAYRKKLRT